jgi:hypothetical protein
MVPRVTYELTHPCADVVYDVEWYDTAECALEILEIFESHFLVVPGRVMLGEVIR